MDKEKALKATRNGAIAAFISAGLTVLITSLAIYSDAEEGLLGYLNDPIIFFEVVLIVICAIGMLRRSRVAAVVIFIYFIFAKVFFVLETGKFAGLGMGLLFLYFYGKAIQGAFVYRRIEREENPNYKRTSRWRYYVGIPVGVLVLALMVLGLLTMTSVLPSTEVLSGSRMHARDISLLTEQGLISPDEEMLYFYSDGFLSILETGSILTNSRVVAYTQEEGDMQIYEMFFKDITSIELIEEGDFLNDSIYEVNSEYDGSWLRLHLSTESKGDQKFIEELKKRVSLVGGIQTFNRSILFSTEQARLCA